MVAFHGDSGFSAGPVPLDRAGQHHLAERAGCHVWPRITKQVRLCVVANPDHETGNLRKAEEYGIALIREAEFWRALGAPVSRRP